MVKHGASPLQKPIGYWGLRGTNATYSENHAKPINTLYAQNAVTLMLKQVVYIVTDFL
jgi:hypothetical protein